ncbi:NEL-type E3 ubiquitin ligase domain-containing protein [Pseudomonas entomophila]|uniref:NEL-type E3 ubiquitin ligase domain-containing protein n=1 Tax=Pseudomonas entomophila TaxID=312306 RepID=UPI0023D89E08|nr:NEL-type E3 ubiquitin ligase domain-containing protein [Pseudomonas entomophila]MDF0731532.1 NEL-type E3 ubiquitin ligase domain-containing protein [Pseudomonas entomophila]
MPSAVQTLDTLDQFLGENLPDWLRKATPQAIVALRAAFAVQRASENLLTQAFARLRPPQAFAQALLQEALRAKTGLALDLGHALWRERWQNYSLLGGGELITHDSFEPALAHLMQNFAEDFACHANSGVIHREPGHPLDVAPLLIDTATLAAICREVDAGRRYQEHLDQVLDEKVSQALGEEKRQRLALAIELAELKGDLNPTDVALLRQVLAQSSSVSSATVSAKCLRILGHTLSAAVVFELPAIAPGQSSPHDGQAPGIILYLAHRPLQRFASWAALSTHLQSLLGDAKALAALLEMLRLEDRVPFQSTLRKRLSDPQVDLELSAQVPAGGLFAELVTLHLEQLRADALYLLVPVAKADEESKRERLNTWESVGSNLLQLAAFFVPGLNQLLLAQMVVQTLREAYEGVVDWQRGHQHEALEHLLSVAEAVAVNAVFAAGGTAVARGLQRSAFVEQMVPVRSGVGGRLWAHDLQPFRSRSTPPNVTRGRDGLYRHDGRQWWRRHNDYFEMRHDRQLGHWRLVRTDGDLGFAPQMQWNGECGWRLAWQRPQEWVGAQVLLGHLWAPAWELDAERVAQVMRIADIDEAALHALVAQQRKMPVALRDTLERYDLDSRIDRFFAGVRHDRAFTDQGMLSVCLAQLPAAHQVAGQRRQAMLAREPELRAVLMDKLSDEYLQRDPLATIVTRDFPGLPSVYAHDVMQHASEAQREHMSLKLALPLPLAERARAALVEARLTRTLQGLYLNNAYSDHLPDLVFALLLRGETWPRDINFEVRRGSVNGHPLARLHTIDVEHPPRVLVDHRGQLQVYEGGRRLFTEQPGPGDLFGILWHFLPEAERERLRWTGPNAIKRMRRDLQARLPGTRANLMAMLGIRTGTPRPTPPQRLPDGRFGYLLSGRGDAAQVADRTLQDRVRSLYPGFNERQLQDYLQVLEEQPGSPFTALLQEEQSFQQLDQALSRWCEEAEQDAQRSVRQRVADELRRCWRMQGLAGRHHANGDPGMLLDLGDIAARQLPALPAQAGFLHVTEMSLVNMQLQEVPSDFLRPFRHLLRLNLDNNRLLTLPSGVAGLSRLRELTLSRNHMDLDIADFDTLAALSHLRVLVLSGNPLGRFPVALERLPRLRQLGLRDTGLTALPEHLALAVSLDYVDLRDNRISVLPQAVADYRPTLRRGLALQGNPLPADYPQRWLGIESASDSEASVEEGPVSRLRWLEGASPSQRILRTVQWERMVDEPGSEDFFRLLRDLTGTSDFRLARDDLQGRVWSMFEALEHNGALRQELFELASQPRTCVDSVISCFAALEVRALSVAAVRDSAGNGEVGLLSLARRLFRLDQVERFARADMSRRQAEGRGVDEVEVSLAYRVGLATRLDLPGQPRTLQFGAVAGVSAADLDAAAEAVRQAEASDALVTYVSERDFWLRHLRQLHGDAFEAIEAPYWTCMETLDDQRLTLGDQAYLVEVERVASEREAALAQEARRLSREALARLSD